MSQWLIPLLLCLAMLCGLTHRTDVFAAFTEGAADGLRVTARILPPLILLMTAIAMFRASGGMDVLIRFLSPLLTAVGLPPETAPLMLLRPLSGSGSTAVLEDVLRQSGADSTAGRTAAVMVGSSETTFYTLAVYFGSAGVTETRYALPVCLLTDCFSFILAALAVRLFFAS